MILLLAATADVFGSACGDRQAGHLPFLHLNILQLKYQCRSPAGASLEPPPWGDCLGAQDVK